MKRRLNLRFALALVAVGVVAAGIVHLAHGMQLRRSAGILRQQAEERLAAGRPGDAIGYLQRYVQLAPQDTDGLAKLGMTQAEVGAVGAAFMTLDQVLRREPQRRAERRKLVEVAMRIGRWSDAVDHLQNHLLDPSPEGSSNHQPPSLSRRESADDGAERTTSESSAGEDVPTEDVAQAGTAGDHPGGMVPDPAAGGAVAEAAELNDLLGQCRFAQQQFELARTAFQSAIDLAPAAAETHLRLATLLRDSLELPADADAVMDRLVAGNQQSSAAYLARARYRLAAVSAAVDDEATRLETAADEDVQRALELAPDDPETLLLAAASARRNDRPDEARVLLERGIALVAKEPRWYQELAQLEVELERSDEAVAALRRGLAALPGEQDLLWNLADLSIQTGDRQTAGEVLTQLRDGGYPRVPLEYVASRIAVAEEKWLAASQTLEGARAGMDEWPDLAKQADFWLGQCYERLGNTDQQLSAFRRAVAVDRDWVPARLGLAGALVSSGRLDEAIEEYRLLMQRPSAPAAGFGLLARLMVFVQLRRPATERNWGPVEQVLDLAEQATPDATDVPILRAEALVAQAQFDAAREALLQARDKRPDELRLWLATAALEQRLDRPDDAAAVLDEAQQKLGDSVDVRLARLRLLVQRHGLEAADYLAALDTGLEAFSPEDQVRLLSGLAAGYRSINDLDRAATLWADVAARDPGNLASRLYLFDLALVAQDQSRMQGLLADIQRIEGSQSGPLWRYGESVRLLLAAEANDAQSLARAQSMLTAARAQRPAWSRIPLLLAEVDRRLDNPTAEAGHLGEAVELGDRNPSVVQRLVQLLYQERRFIEADQALRKFEERQAPFTADLNKLAAEVSFLVEDYSRALDLAARAAASSTDYADHIWHAHLLRASGKLPEAEAAFRKAVELAADEPAPWVALVQHLTRVGRADEIDAVLAEALTRIPAQDHALVLAQCYDAMARVAEAGEQYQAALAAAPDVVSVQHRVADFFLRTGQADKATPLLRQLIDDDVAAAAEDVSWARRSLAIVLAADGGNALRQQALALIELNLADAPQSALDRRAKALVLASAPGRRIRREAIAILEDLVERGSQQEASWKTDRFLLAQLYRADGDWPRARRHLQGLLASFGDDARFVALYVRETTSRGDLGEARLWLDRLLELEADSPRTAETQARVLAADGRAAEAIAVLDALLAQPAAQPPAEEPAATAEVDSAAEGAQDRSLLAVARLLEELAVAAAKSDPAAGDALLVAAESRLRQWVAEAADRRLALAAFLGRQKREAEALEIYERCWGNGPSEAVAAGSVALISAPGADPALVARVEKSLEAALADGQPTAGLLLATAQLRDVQRRYADAEELYRRVLAGQPDNVVALNNLALLLALQNRGGDEPLTLMGRAIDAAGPVSALLDSRGSVHVALAQPAGATTDLTEAIFDDPSAARYFHLAQAHDLAGNAASAREAWVKAVDAGLTEDSLHPLEQASYRGLAARFAPSSP